VCILLVILTFVYHDARFRECKTNLPIEGFQTEIQSFRILWPCIVNIRWREGTNKMQLIRCLLSIFLSQHVSGIVMPIIKNIRPCSATCGFLPGRVGCGWLWSCGAASWESSRRSSTEGRTPHALGHGLILLMMSIMMPETCWDRKFDNKHRIGCILFFLSLSSPQKFKASKIKEINCSGNNTLPNN